MNDKATADREYHGRIAAEYFARHRWPIQRYTCEVERKWITRFVPANSDVLVAGCGGGREVPWLRGMGCRLVGLDYSKEMIDLARHAHGEEEGLEWIEGDVHSLASMGRRFDAVVCLAAVNYFEDIPGSIQAMHDVLNPGGRIIVSSINRLHSTEAGFDQNLAKSNRRPLDSDEFTVLAEAAGFRLISILHFRVLPDLLPPAWNRVDAPILKRTTIEAAILADRWWRRLPARQGKFFWLVADKE